MEVSLHEEIFVRPTLDKVLSSGYNDARRNIVIEGWSLGQKFELFCKNVSVDGISV